MCTPRGVIIMLVLKLYNRKFTATTPSSSADNDQVFGENPLESYTRQK